VGYPRSIAAAITIALAACGFAPHARADELAGCNTALVRGQELARDGKLLEARAAYPACLRAVCPESLRAVCANFVAELAPRIPSLRVDVRGPQGSVEGARLFVDGALAPDAASVVEVDPGEHVVRVEAPRCAPSEQHVTIGAGERPRAIPVTLALASAPGDPGLEPAPAPSRLPASVYVLGGVGAVALGSFAYFALRGKHTENDLRATCPTGLCDSTPMRQQYLAADISLGVALVAAGVAVWVALTSGPSAPPPRQARHP
jgi:hypothetical protein